MPTFKTGLLVVTLLAVGIGGCRSGPADLKVRFPSAKGVKPGAAVFLLGVEVGKVDGISFDDSHVVFDLKITQKVKMFRAKDKIQIINQGLLGDKAIQITPGPTTALPVGPGQIVEGMEPSDNELLVKALKEILSAPDDDRNRVIEKWRPLLELNSQFRSDDR
ncbi:MAG: MCE family protein [Acidobacteria bacterium]|nr:MCE family protein [Acidobacteriota bacterium]